MEAIIYRDDMKKRILYPFQTEEAYIYFINNILKFKILKIEEEKFLILIPDNFLIQERYKEIIWYRSRDKKFGIFEREGEWKIVFQQ